MQLIAKTANETITVFNSKDEIFGVLRIDLKSKNHQIITNGECYQLVQEKWFIKVVQNQNTIFHLRTNKFWGTIKIEELNKDIRGVFGHEWGTQLRDSNKITLLKIKNESKWKNTGNYIIQLEKESIAPIEVLLTLFGHVVCSIANQNLILYT